MKFEYVTENESDDKKENLKLVFYLAPKIMDDY